MKNLANKENLFDNFTNLYSLQKTLRFELKPTPETKSLEEVIKKDKEIDHLYNEEMKPMFDKLHEKFINESLEKASLSLDLLEKLENQIKILKELSKDRKNNREKINQMESDSGEIAKLQNKLRKEIVSFFVKNGNEWKEKYSDIKLKENGYEILIEENILNVLARENPQKENIIKKFKGFFTYFSGFNQNRENYYSSETKTTSIANRIINENLIIFLNNKQKIQNLSEKTSHFKQFENYFSLENFNQYLTQAGIEKINIVIGEINKQTNLFSQQYKDILPKAPILKKLKKQIGCGKKENFTFTIKEGKEWENIQELINLQYKEIELFGKKIKLLDEVRNLYEDFFNSYETYELDKIYFNKQSINTISSLWFVNWHKLSELLAAKKVIKNKDKNKEYTIPKKISLLDLKEVLENEENVEVLFRKGRATEEESEKAGQEKRNPSGEYEKLFADNAWKTLLNIWQYEINKNFRKAEKFVRKFETIKKISFEKIEKNERTKFIKDLCDSFLIIERMVKYHNVKEETIKDDNFYAVIDLYLQENNLRKYYNAFRNYLTKKPFSEDKIKLNFGSGQLLGGFDKNKEREKLGIILRKNGIYYLGIIDKSYNDIFDEKKHKTIYNVNNTDWEKMEYKFIGDVKKQIPRMAFAKKNKVKFGLTEEIIKIKKEYDEFQKEKALNRDLWNKQFDKNKITKLIGYYQKVLISNGYKEIYKLSWKSPEKYSGIGEFNDEIARQSYNVKFRKIDDDYINLKVKNGELYLFKIHNRDFSDRAKGIINIHSMYFINLFSEENLKKYTLRLSGKAEVFYRPASIKIKREKRKFPREIIGYKRYTEPKIFFHFPISINEDSEKITNYNQFNRTINNNLLKNNNKNFAILGIDRGEKNLLYYSLINNKGEIINQGSFNKIKCGNKVVDYNKLLSQRAQEMKNARQSWETIGKIKDLKEGYLSQVIHEIYKIIINNNAIIVLEDLNSEFKAKRTAKFEKSVYKKFELALARKLNHLVLKNKKADERGGVLDAYQLTPFVGAGDMGKFEKAKQWGIIFYVRPDYTSAIDPVTGWRKTIYISNSASAEKIKEELFDKNKVKISFDNEKKCFKFSYEKWNLYAFNGIERLYWNRNERNSEGSFGNMKKYNLYEEFKNLFSGLDISRNINEQITNKIDFNWKNLIFYWNLLNQIRNTDKSKEGDDNDFIQSPVWSDKINNFYDSRKKYSIKLPNNGDANGAYNIARKGIMLLERIKNNPKEPDLFIKNVDWDEFVQK